MAVAEQLEIRVNDIVVTGIRLQRGMVQGYPGGPWEVRVGIPGLGYIELDDKPDFIIEIKDPKASVEKRQWKRVTLPELIWWLENLGVIQE